MRPNNIPIFVLAALIVVMAALVFKRSHHPPSFLTGSSMSGAPLPKFQLPELTNSAQRVSSETLRGHVFLLNFWASWCSACAAEHATLMLAAKQYHVPIFGIAYKDDTENAKNWLQDFGNPFAVTAIDAEGSLQQKFELYGLPLTYVIDKKGLIRFEFMGVIDETLWEKMIWPKVQAYELEE